jgi:peptidoglycan hydrolase-like protein with peptidoglycan-binding domain
MKKFSIVALVVASMVGALPSQAAADAKDVAIGAILGAIGQKIVSDSKQKQRTTRSSTSTRKQYVAPSLNSQFSRDERIQIQSSLASLGYGIGTIDGVLGPNSRRVIGQFQASRGEAATGQMTRAQYVALISAVSGTTPVFARRELNRDEVRLLQQGLQQLGYYRGAIDGAKGPGTRGALAQFLAQNGLNAAQTTPVQGLVLARNAAQLPTAMYLQQEAGANFAGGVPQQPFGGQPQQQTLQAGFGQQPQQQQNPFAAPVPQQNAFGAPAQMMPQQQPNQATGFATAPATANPSFGTPQQVPQPGTQLLGAPQQQAPSGQQNLFAPAAPQQQAPQVAPTGQQPQQGLFAAGNAQQAAPQVQQSTLDIFSAPGTAQPAQATGQAQLLVPQQQQVPVTTQQPQGSLFGTPASN